MVKEGGREVRGQGKEKGVAVEYTYE